MTFKGKILVKIIGADEVIAIIDSNKKVSGSDKQIVDFVQSIVDEGTVVKPHRDGLELGRQEEKASGAFDWYMGVKQKLIDANLQTEFIANV